MSDLDEFDELEIKKPLTKRITVIRRALSFAKSEKKRFSLGALFMILGSVSALSQPLVFRHIFDVNLPAKDESGVLLSATIFLFLLGFASLFSYLQSILLGTAGVTIVNHLKRTVYDQLLNFEISYFDQNPVGRLVARVESDCERLVGLFTRVGLQMVSTALLLIGTLIILYPIEWRLALLLNVLVLLILFGASYFFQKMRPMFREERAKVASVTAVVSEFTQGARLLRMLNRESYAEQRLETVNTEKVRFLIRIFVRFTFLFLPIGFFQVALIGGVLWFGADQGKVGAFTIGTLVMFAQYLTQLFRPLFEFTEQMGEIQRALGSADRIFELLDREPGVKNPSEPKVVPQLTTSIRLEQVHFHYKENKPVLFDVNLEIPAGSKIAIVGPTGGGKTTLINLLCRFYDPIRGRVLWNGLDVRFFSQREYREKIGIVLQDLYLFPGNVAENLAVLRKDVSRSQIEKAIDQLGIWDVFRHFPNGLDTVFAERSANISFGERQLVAFTRALVFEPELLILDEATSSVDPETERIIEKSLEALLQHRTSVIVAHRLSTIRNADAIAVIKDGRIVEFGNHSDLIKRNGLYTHLYRIQFPEAVDRVA